MESSKFYCEICQKDFVFRSKFERHLNTSSHRGLEAIIGMEPEISTPGSTPSDVYLSASDSVGHEMMESQDHTHVI